MLEGVETSFRGPVIDAQEEEAPPLGELIGIAAAIVLLTLLFRSVVAMTITLVAALLGLAFGLAALALISAGVKMPTVAPTLGLMLGLGAGVDYALFLVARYRERLQAGDEPLQAVARANGSTGVAVLAAGTIVVVAISGLLAVGIPFVGRMGLGAAIVVAATAVSAVTIVPAFLGLARRRVLAPSQRSEGHPDMPATENTRAARMAEAISRRPVISAVAATAVLLALTAPVLALELGQPDDGTRQADATQRIAYDRLSEGFGAGFNGPLVIAVALPDERLQAKRSLTALSAEIERLPGVAAVAAPAINRANDAATVTVIPKTSPQSGATQTLVETLRDQAIPAAITGTGAKAYVGGATATYSDLADKVSSRLPVFIAIVVGLSLLLLMAVFRSIWLAVVSAVFNLLSIGAAYGVVTLAFQTGPGTDLLGVAEQPIVSFVPMIMFAILFGLSMDYNVFLLSRVREEWLDHGDPKRALIGGVGHTAAVIGTAGMIMTLVFLGFMVEDDAIVKMIGLGLATAVAIDVTLVRLALAPAVITLLGERAWWFPSWLDRLLPRIDLEGAQANENVRQPA